MRVKRAQTLHIYCILSLNNKFGYPIDAIRLIEDKFSTLSTMDLNDSLRFIRKNINYARSFLDNYEMELLYSAIEG